jgi:polyphosphate:AMP phosphotransferase
MLEALETGKSLDDKAFKAQRDALRPSLIALQQAMRARQLPMLVVLGGLDGSGRGSVSQRINEWMDPRLIDTHAFWLHSDEEESRPRFWRFWRCMPAQGNSAVMLGAWYEAPAYRAMSGEITEDTFLAQLREIEAFERLLCDDGMLIVKIWLHVSRRTQRRLLAREVPEKGSDSRVPSDAGQWWKRYPRALEISEDLLRFTDSGHSPWHRIEADDPNYRDIAVASTLIEAMQAHLDSHSPRQPAPAPDAQGAESRHAHLDATARLDADTHQPTVLDGVDLGQALDRKTYKQRLRREQKRLRELAWRAHREKVSLVAVFEGWDAAGKGSAIKRVTAGIDPRLYKLFQFAAPSDEEAAHHYLWRFWRRLQRDGCATLCDRSWYGRVLVERVEQLATHEEWQRAYSEINQFEAQLVHHGCLVAKFWIHISEREQLARFLEREKTPHKQHKISEDDWRNRERWADYEAAVEDMVARTSTAEAPWTLVAGEDKRFARVQILSTLCDLLEGRLGRR